jgi:hypothetical protein
VNNMIGISGYARSGKDTFGEALQRILKEYGIKAKTYALATQLKHDITFLTEGDFNISAFTKDDQEKKIIRPLLVGYGEAWRRADPEHWLSIVDSNLEPKTLPIITDIRYENEADYILENQGFLLNLKRNLPNGELIGPANIEEEKNSPFVEAKSSFHFVWQTVEDQKTIDDLVESFIISVLEDELESWKAIYPL